MKTMKKSMFIAAIAAMVLAGCTKDESIVEQQEIGFQPLAYKASQTKTETTTQPTTDNVITDAFYPTNGPSFGLFAYQLTEGTFDANKADAKLYIDNKPVKYTSNYWRTDPKSFWPLQGSLTFIAYSPYSEKDKVTHAIMDVVDANQSTVKASVLKITDFQVGTTGQKDLMWSNLSKDKTSNGSDDNYPEASPTYAGVPILFNHALCRIKITAKTAENYSSFATYNLKQIQVVGLKDNATLTVIDDVAKWSVAQSTTLADFDFYKDNQLLTKDSKPVIYKNAETAGNGLLAIPQSLNGVQLLVTYTMTVDPNGQVDDDEVVTETTKTVTLFKSGELETLEQNKVYTLNLSISADEILYSPDVNDWEVSYNHDQDGATPDVNYGGDYVVPQQ
jgi:hypothetical protein